MGHLCGSQRLPNGSGPCEVETWPALGVKALEYTLDFCLHHLTNGDRMTKSTVSFNSMTGDAFQQVLHRNNLSGDLSNTSYIFLSFDMT